MRKTGVVSTVLPSPGKYGGSYGVIVDEADGKDYVWSSGNVFRDMTFMKVGLRVTFAVVCYSYATDITSKGLR